MTIINFTILHKTYLNKQIKLFSFGTQEGFCLFVFLDKDKAHSEKLLAHTSARQHCVTTHWYIL